MPKQKRKKRIRSSVGAHRRQGKKLVPPAVALLDKLETVSWMNDRLPEMLWASLILTSTNRKDAFGEFNRLLEFVASHERKEEFSNLTLTGFSNLEADLPRIHRRTPMDGVRTGEGRVRELQGGWPGLHWGRWEVGGRSSAAAQCPYGRLREPRCAGWRENTQQGTLADRDDASLRGRWVSCRLAVRLGVEWRAAGPGRD